MSLKRRSMGPWTQTKTQAPRQNSAYKMQEETRTKYNFGKTESDLSQISSSRTSSDATQGKPKHSKFFDVIYRITKMPRPVKPEHEVWLLDNTAYRNEKTGAWEAEYVAAVFSEQESWSVVDAATNIANKLDMKDNDPQYETLQNRLRPFLQDMLPGGRVKVRQGSNAVVTLDPAGSNGISTSVQPLHGKEESEKFIKARASVPKGTAGILEMRTFCAEPEGWAIISDIDDTIKVTNTSDPTGILRTTFIDSPQVCAGMPELYRHIGSLVGAATPWFYLSSSPYNLYPFLRDFNATHYPRGTIILRDQNWLDPAGLLKNLTYRTEEYKVDRMEKIQSWLPRRKMILIGDSTQSDPESYGDIYRKFPQWVRLILIRKETDIAAVGLEEKNEPSRFEEAFKDVPREAWHVFEDPAECNDIVARTVGGK